MRRSLIVLTTMLALVALAVLPTARADDLLPAVPPAQPEAGPHGSEYPYPDAPRREGVDGLGGFTVYEPQPTPVAAVPVVLLMRGACPTTCDQTASNNMLNALRDHLVKKGNVVVFPHFQDANGDDVHVELGRIQDALRAARVHLAQPGRAPVDWNRFGVAGHSRGSQMTFNYAVTQAAAGDLPTPKWLLVIEPGPTSEVFLDQAANIAAETKVVVVVGQDDALASDTKAQAIWAELDHIPDANKDYVLVRSDRRGPWAARPLPAPECETTEPGTLANVVACASTNLAWSFTVRRNEARNLVNPAASTGDLTADHYFPGAGSPLDVFALWKLAQGLGECAHAGTSCAYVLGGGPPMTDMGVWSDGTPVSPLCVTEDPAHCPRR